MASPSKISSGLPSSPPTVRKITPPVARLASRARPVPSQMLRNWSFRPIRPRKARMMLIIREASSPSLRVMRKEAVILPPLPIPLRRSLFGRGRKERVLSAGDLAGSLSVFQKYHPLPHIRHLRVLGHHHQGSPAG